MPKLSVIQIFSGPAVYNGVNKTTQKPYTIYSWGVLASIDNGQQVTTTLKSMKNIEVKPGEFEVKRSDYNGNISYMIQSEKKEFQRGGYYRVNYSLTEYDDLWKHAVKMVFKGESFKDIPAEHRKDLVSTYIISACQSGVKIPEIKDAILSASKTTPIDKSTPGYAGKVLAGGTEIKIGNKETAEKPKDLAADFYDETEYNPAPVNFDNQA